MDEHITSFDRDFEALCASHGVHAAFVLVQHETPYGCSPRIGGHTPLARTVVMALAFREAVLRGAPSLEEVVP